jgi:hypothetical protein
MKTGYASVALAVVVILLSSNAEAYIGPGSGLSAFGAVAGFFAAVFFALVGFIWYPLKRLRRSLRKQPKNEELD